MINSGWENYMGDVLDMNGIPNIDNGVIMLIRKYTQLEMQKHSPLTRREHVRGSCVAGYS